MRNLASFRPFLNTGAIAPPLIAATSGCAGKEARMAKSSIKIATAAIGVLAVVSGISALAGASGSYAQSAPQGPCFTHDELREGLARDYREQPSALGQMGEQTLMEVYVSDSGSWTMVLTGVNGQSCIVAAGEGWEQTRGSSGSGA
jgi:hypothetical protein